MASHRSASEPYEIRPARPDDLAGVHTIEQASFTDPWSLRALQAELERATSLFLVAARDGAPPVVAGYAIAHVVADEAEIANVAVASTHRGQGIGAMLVQDLLDRARQLGAHDCWLEVRDSNAAARALYGQLGFDDVGRRKRYYARPVEDAVIMRRSLRGP